MFVSDTAPTDPHRPPSEWLQRLAWLCAALVLVITCLSAYIRLSNKAPRDCPPSQLPQCHAPAPAQTPAQVEPHAPAPALSPSPSPTLSLARMAHRGIASCTLLVVLALSVMAWRGRLKAQTRMALGLVGLALFLAALGRWTGPSPSAIVMLGNVLGGFLMFALSVCLADSLRQPLAALVPSSHTTGPQRAPEPSAKFPLAWIAVGVWVLVQTALGVLSTEVNFPVLHRVSGLMLALILMVLSWLAWRQSRQPTLRRPMPGLILVWVLMWVLPWVSIVSGLTAIALKQPVAWVLLHNFSAALLLSAIFLIAARACCIRV